MKAYKTEFLANRNIFYIASFSVFLLQIISMSITILSIESSCDDTSAAVLQDTTLLSNIVAGQSAHLKYGGVVPELASRAHQQNIIPVVDLALKEANIAPTQLNAIAFTRGPGLLGSLLVGTSFAKGFSIANNIPIIEVNHLQGHILAHFIQEKNLIKEVPKFPFICLLVSGGHTQLMLVNNYFDMETIGQTIDDAAGEAFDKCGKTIGLPYPAGPIIDKLSETGNPLAFQFNKPKIQHLNYSFSGLKTSFLYFVRDQIKQNPHFIEENKNDLCASLQHTIVDILLNKVKKAVKETGVKDFAIAGGVSANSGLRKAAIAFGEKNHINIHIPQAKFTTDNAAMIGITAYFKYLNAEFSDLSTVPIARMPI
jgi:N6-L-threonylcarbamoyladenine synthase